MSPISGLAGFGGGVSSKLLGGGGAAGGGGGFTSLSFYVAVAVNPNYSVRGFTISLGHSDGTNSVSFNYSDTKTLVYKDTSTTEFTAAETTGEMNIVFGSGDSSVTQATSWEWNGTNDIIVETCTSQNQTNYHTSGQMRYGYLALATKFSRADTAGDSCTVTPTSSQNYAFSTKLIFPDGSSYQPYWTSTAFTSSSTNCPINVFYRRNITRYILQVDTLNNSFVS